VGKVRLVDTGKGSFFGDYLYEQVLDQDDFGGIAATVRLGAVHGAAAVGLSRDPDARQVRRAEKLVPLYSSLSWA